MDQHTVVSQRRILRPIPQLHGQTRLVTAALLIPVFAAVLWFAIPRGTWPRVLVALAIVTAVYVLASFLLSRVCITIGRDGISERGFFSRTRIPAKRIESALILNTYRGQSLETAPRLFLLDTHGEALLQMRGQYWNRESIEAVATAFDVPVRRIDDPLTRSELRRDHLSVLYWFERWPWLGGIILAGSISAFSLVLILLMSPESLVITS